MTSPKPSTQTNSWTLHDFARSHWRIERDITHLGVGHARFLGEAHWHREKDGRATYFEMGRLSMNGATPETAQQGYVWDDALNVYFQDGRFFHRVPATGGPVFHECAPDTYAGSYTFLSETEFVVTWHVTGPRKNYEMVSTFTRGASLDVCEVT